LPRSSGWWHSATGYNPSAMCAAELRPELRIELGAEGAGYAVWTPADRTLGVAFVGCGSTEPRADILAAISNTNRSVAFLRQVHGSDCLDGRPGCVGEGDALTTDSRDIALAISTADCVPVVLLTPGRATAVHAGWRGIVAGVVHQAVESFSGNSDPIIAWIGPAIGRCCYEVGHEVAQSVLEACGDRRCLEERVAPSRPHLDLSRAVESQLRSCGVECVERVSVCTRCDSRLHSFRRDGAASGRNLTFAWLPAS